MAGANGGAKGRGGGGAITDDRGRGGLNEGGGCNGAGGGTGGGFASEDAVVSDDDAVSPSEHWSVDGDHMDCTRKSAPEALRFQQSPFGAT